MLDVKRVRFIGKTEFSKDGILYGIELYQPNGIHNGTFRGKTYFVAPDKHGLFTTSNLIHKLEQNQQINNELKAGDKNISTLQEQVTPTTAIQLGYRVLINNKGEGIVKFIGQTHFSHGLLIYGIELEDPLGLNNGTKDGKKYFECQNNHGIFCKRKHIKKIISTQHFEKETFPADGMRIKLPIEIGTEVILADEKGFVFWLFNLEH